MVKSLAMVDDFGGCDGQVNRLPVECCTNW